MENIGGIIWFIIMIIFFIARSSQKNAKNQQQSNTAANQKNPTLQSQLNRAMRQINEIKNIATEQITEASRQPIQRGQSSTSTRPTRISEYNSSLEGHVMEGHKVEGYQMEGHKVEGHKVEGHKVEGIAQKHNTKKFNKNRIAVTESSMKRGYAGEGCDEHYDYDISYSKRAVKAKKAKLHFSDNPIVQGVVMSQILERPRR